METDNCLLDKIQQFTLHYKNQTKTEQVDNLFKKRFLISDEECYSLPEPNVMFKDIPWTVDILQRVKDELNSVKNLLNNYNPVEWHSHTKYRNSARNVMIRIRSDIQPEFLTQAWCKFYEIVSTFPIVPIGHITQSNKCFTSIHLCEAPGAFVVSLNHWLKNNAPDLKWHWIATSLNPYYEGNPVSMMIDDDRFMRHTLNHWCFGEDNTGNMMNLKNLDELVRVSEEQDKVFLVTADGSIDCTDMPGEQETMVSHLHYCEVVTALHLLTTGGCFVLKVFTIFEYHSICLIYLLCCCFNEVNIVKPVTSKEGNSESYVVCTDFKGPTIIFPYLKKLREHYECDPKVAMFSKKDIPETFLQKIITCAKFFQSEQCLAITKNILSFKSHDRTKLRNMKHIQNMVADKYINDYNVQRLYFGEIVGKSILEKANCMNFQKRALLESYNERCMKQHLAPQSRLKEHFNDSDNIEIHIPTDESIELQISKLPECLQIRTGKIFRKVCSTRFCSAGVLKMYRSVENIVSNSGCIVQFPSIYSENNSREEIHTSKKCVVLKFEYTAVYDSHDTIVKIHDTLQRLQYGETLILVAFPLFTHLNVGLLYFISCAFNSLNIKLSSNIGSEITLNHFNCQMEVMKDLISIKYASCQAQENEKAVFEILPPPFLYDCDLFSTIVEINHWVIKSFIRHAFYTLEGNSASKQKIA